MSRYRQGPYYIDTPRRTVNLNDYTNDGGLRNIAMFPKRPKNLSALEFAINMDTYINKLSSQMGDVLSKVNTAIRPVSFDLDYKKFANKYFQLLVPRPNSSGNEIRTFALNGQHFVVLKTYDVLVSTVYISSVKNDVLTLSFHRNTTRYNTWYRNYNDRVSYTSSDYYKLVIEPVLSKLFPMIVSSFGFYYFYREYMVYNDADLVRKVMLKRGLGATSYEFDEWFNDFSKDLYMVGLRGHLVNEEFHTDYSAGENFWYNNHICRS